MTCHGAEKAAQLCACHRYRDQGLATDVAGTTLTLGRDRQHTNRTTSTANIQKKVSQGKRHIGLRDSSTAGRMNRCVHLVSYETGMSGKAQLALWWEGGVFTLRGQKPCRNVTNMTRKPVWPTCGRCRMFPEKNGNPACQWVLGPEAFPRPCLTKYDCRVREGSDVSHGEGARGHGAWAGTHPRRRLLR